VGFLKRGKSLFAMLFTFLINGTKTPAAGGASRQNAGMMGGFLKSRPVCRMGLHSGAELFGRRVARGPPNVMCTGSKDACCSEAWPKTLFSNFPLREKNAPGLPGALSVQTGGGICQTKVVLVESC
jgi:hypothetical protein